LTREAVEPAGQAACNGSFLNDDVDELDGNRQAPSSASPNDL
jgi:hypothetical protein